MIRELRRRTTALPRDSKAASAFVNDLLEAAPAAYGIKAHQSGWREFEAAPGPSSGSLPPEFVTPGQTIALGPLRYRWHETVLAGPHLGQEAGDLASWHHFIGRWAEQSSILALAIMAGLAGPLLPFAEV